MPKRVWEIKSRDGSWIVGEEAISLFAALEQLVRRGADLRDADLCDADLRGAYLRGADLCGADLRDAYLRGAYLCDAYLCDADLRGAYLRGADLRGADLRGAYLRWNSHDLLSALLFRAAADDVGRRKLAGLVAVSRDWCWDEFLALDDPLTPWALDVLAEAANPADAEIPAVVRERMLPRQCA